MLLIDFLNPYLKEFISNLIRNFIILIFKNLTTALLIFQNFVFLNFMD